MRTHNGDYDEGNGKENVPASHFMTDGKVDPRKVKSVDCGEMDSEECDEFRRQLAEAPPGVSVKHLSKTDESEWSPSTVRTHVSGKCLHHNQQPPLEYDGHAWSVVDERGGDDE